MNLRLSFAALAGLAYAHANANIVSTTSDFVISTPTDVSSSPSTPMPDLTVFAEQQGVTLASNLAIDDAPDAHIGAYSVASSPDMIPGALGGSRPYDSYMIFCDPDGPALFHDGTVTFDKPIVGLDPTIVGLNASNSIFGLASVNYGTFTGLDGLEIDGRDNYSISADRLTLTIHLRSQIPGDRFRVLTANPVPEPMTLGVLAIGLSSVFHRRRKAKS